MFALKMHSSSLLFIASFLALLSGLPQNGLHSPDGSHLPDLQSKGCPRNLVETAPILNCPNRRKNGPAVGEKNAVRASACGGRRTIRVDRSGADKNISNDRSEPNKNASLNVGALKRDIGPIENAKRKAAGASGSAKAKLTRSHGRAEAKLACSHPKAEPKMECPHPNEEPKMECPHPNEEPKMECPHPNEEPKMECPHPNAEAKMDCSHPNGEKKDVSSAECIADGGSELPFGCTEEEMKKELTRNQLIDLTDSCGWFVLDKKLVYLSFHHHKRQLTRTYYGMMNKLRGVLNDLAEEHGMPEEEKEKCWEECRKELIQKMKDLDQFCQKSSDTFLKKKYIWRLDFDFFLTRYYMEWDNVMKENAKKWPSVWLKRVKDRGLLREAVPIGEASKKAV
ncbi:RAD protein (Pv-fam-e) [Plasmodium vivax Brazil I]|uniref:RAD protein (Pv-fam-e) n=1 Tax=Plasmodium vivax (strain Brazil I) TaxID=1033975 RepID=A0A0J9SYD4_PLAV1|nr:RAD protein (Pv-fam-e) [Plasmodium vivax Brazil I]